MRSSLEFFLGYMYKRNAPTLAAANALELVITGTKVAYPMFAFRMMKNMEDSGAQFTFSAISLMAFMTTTFLPRVRDYLIGSVTHDVQKGLTVDMVGSVYKRELDSLLAAPTGECAVITSKNYGEVGNVIPSLFSEILPVITETVFTSFMMYRSFGVVGIMPVGILTAYLGTALKGEKHSEALKEANSRSKISGFGALLGAINHYQLAHQFGNVKHELRNLSDKLSDLEGTYLNMRRSGEKNSLVLSIVSRVGFLGALLYVLQGSQLSSNLLTSEQFIVLGYYLFRLNSIIESLPSKINTFYTGLVDANMVINFLQGTSQAQDSETPEPFQLTKAPKIEFRDVNFRYGKSDDDNGKGLSHISFTAEKGQKIALMGPTGCGKSTLLKLLQRFYDYEGEIKVSGVDITHVRKSDLRAHLAVVSQETGLIEGTLYDNIQYGNLPKHGRVVEDTKVFEAAKYSGLDFPKDRFFASIQQGGSNFSGGERQRVTIARALMKPNAYVFLLDEPTSSLDQKKSMEVVGMLDQLAKEGTTIMVTHDPYLAVNADQILYMNEGMITEKGSFDELMERKGDFYEQIQHQCDKLGIRVEDVKRATSDVDASAERHDDGFRQWYRDQQQSMKM